MNKSYIPLLLILATVATVYLTQSQFQGNQSQFKKWKLDFKVSFESQMEEIYRQRVFYQNLKLINEHNANPLRKHEMGVNQFTSLTKEQFIHQYLNSVYNGQQAQIQSSYVSSPNIDIDWTQKGAVSPVKNQGQCAASWAFSCIGGLEGLSKIAYGTLKNFSVQQLVDCSAPYGNRGCTGGYASNGYKYVKDHGICTQQEYPYKAVVQTCRNCTNPFRISGYTEAKGCPELQKAIEVGPVSVYVDATNWMTYRSGILSNCSANINHAPLLVGLTGGAWKIKNSWGSSWGEAGYIRIASGNTCGICSTAAVYPNK